MLRSLALLPQAKAMAEGAVDFVRDGDCMPCASFVLTPDGAYFCDHGGAGREVLGRVIAVLASHAPSVQIEES